MKCIILLLYILSKFSWKKKAVEVATLAQHSHKYTEMEIRAMVAMGLIFFFIVCGSCDALAYGRRVKARPLNQSISPIYLFVCAWRWDEKRIAHVHACWPYLHEWIEAIS